METPNGPGGLSVSIAEIFDVRQGHSGGWMRATFPEGSKIELNRENHALAHVTVGYSGGVVESKGAVACEWTGEAGGNGGRPTCQRRILATQAAARVTRTIPDVPDGVEVNEEPRRPRIGQDMSADLCEAVVRHRRAAA